MIINLTEEQTNAVLELIDQMYDNGHLIEETVDLLCGSDDDVEAYTSISKRDLLRFLLNELADAKHAYMKER